MAVLNFDYHPQFFTATISAWKHWLKEDVFKGFVIIEPAVTLFGDNANDGGKSAYRYSSMA